MKLNLGCGTDKKEGYVNVDISPEVKPDKIHDLNKELPFKNNSVNEILANHILEMIEDIPKALRDFWRVCLGGAIIHIKVPHFSCSDTWTDLTHKHGVGYFSLDYFSVDENPLKKYYSHEYGNRERFLIRKKIVFGRFYRVLGLEYLFNKFPQVYESFFTYIFPAREIKFKLKVVK